VSAEVRFYHLTRKTLEVALPEILTKIVERGGRAVVMGGSAERIDALDQHLWTFRPDSFLPHGASRDGFAEDQPIYLTWKDENPNGARTLLLIDGVESARADDYDLVCELFDGNDEEATAAARARWKAHKTAGRALTYWRQNERGGWERGG